MTKRVPTLLLAATALLTQPLAPPAQASPIAYGCRFAAVREITDVHGERYWMEVTFGYFVGAPDTTAFQVTCWLQTSAELSVAEVPHTRHTCSGEGPQTAHVCVNAVLYEVEPSEYVYFCKHVEWESAVTVQDPAAGDIVDHLLRDLFSTGGVATFRADDLVGSVVTAVNNFLATLLDWEIVTITPTPVRHTVTQDYDPVRPGVQCATVNHLEHVAVWSTVDL